MTSKTPQLPTNPKEALRGMRIFTIALLVGMGIFASLAFLFVNFQGPAFSEEKTVIEDIFIGAAILMAVVCQFFAHTLFRKKLTETKNSNLSLLDKLNQYRASLILYLALCEAPGLFSVILFFLTGKYIFLIITALMGLFMFYKFPTTSKIINDLELDWKDQQELT